MAESSAKKRQQANSSQDEVLFAVAYIGTASRSLGTEHIASIVSASRRRNDEDALSGCLVHAGRNFVQYLEGPQMAVIDCVRRIEAYPRHHEMKMLAVSQITARRFAGWSMGFFWGDLFGCERLERVLTGWGADDSSLLDEICRIGAAAQDVEDSTWPAVVAGPFDVLLRSSRGEACKTTAGVTEPNHR